MKPFAHYNARSVEEALRLLAEYGGKAKLNAGGTDLLGVLKDRILPDYPEAIVNIKTIPGLKNIAEDEEGISIGALVTLAEITASPLVAGTVPLLKEAAKTVASPQIRNMGTVGGNLCQDVRCWYYRYPHEIGGRIMCFRKGGKGCPAAAGENQYHAVMGAKKCHAVCPSDLAVALAALGASVTVAGPGSTTRTVAVEDFYTPLGNVLGPAEMVTGVRFPKPSPAARQTFLKFTLRKPIDFAVVSVAAAVTLERGRCTDARLVLGAVAPAPVRALSAEEFLRGKELTAETAARTAELALAGARPLAKNAYKVEVAKALVKRALLGYLG
jgi:xanthine dehydrogenase YagS FAD-binding subunit